MPVVLAPLALLGVAVGLFLLAEAVVYMLRSIAASLGSFDFAFIHIDFGAIFRTIISPVVSLINLIASGVLQPIASWLVGLVYDVEGLVSNVIDSLEHHAEQIAHVVTTTIPDAVANILGEANTYTDTTVQGVRTQVHDAYNTWEQAHSVADAEQYLANEASAPSVENAILAIAARALLAGENYTDAAKTAAEAYADSKFADAKTYADEQVDNLRISIQGELAIPQGAAIPGIDVQDLIDGAAVVSIGTAVGVIAAKIVDCLVSSCPGNNNFANLLQDALGLIDAASIGVFLGEVVNDPQSAAAGFVSTVQATIGTAESTFDDLLALT